MITRAADTVYRNTAANAASVGWLQNCAGDPASPYVIHNHNDGIFTFTHALGMDRWIFGVLNGDHDSYAKSDEELVAYFIAQGFTAADSARFVARRPAPSHHS